MLPQNCHLTTTYRHTGTGTAYCCRIITIKGSSRKKTLINWNTDSTKIVKPSLLSWKFVMCWQPFCGHRTWVGSCFTGWPLETSLISNVSQKEETTLPTVDVFTHFDFNWNDKTSQVFFQPSQEFWSQDAGWDPVLLDELSGRHVCWLLLREDAVRKIERKNMTMPSFVTRPHLLLVAFSISIYQNENPV